MCRLNVEYMITLYKTNITSDRTKATDTSDNDDMCREASDRPSCNRWALLLCAQSHATVAVGWAGCTLAWLAVPALRCRSAPHRANAL
eukprot:6244675-Amphidinium_carterae.1